MKKINWCKFGKHKYPKTYFEYMNWGCNYIKVYECVNCGNMKFVENGKWVVHKVNK